MEKTTVHVVTHTHWDREWYAPFEIFKGRLVNLIDRLISEIKRYPEFKSFMLDGQTVVLEDYFSAKPENRGKLIELVKKGKVLVGPWYILPDEFLVTGESMIRNFLTGQEVLKKLGVPSMKVGYLPDMFGHNAYTPTLLKGLGLESAVVWRGVGDACRKTEFKWSSPNGNEEILTVNLLHGYGNGAHYGRNMEEIKEAFLKEIDFLKKHKTSNNILIMNGTDHEFPLFELPKKFPEWSKDANAEIIHSALPQYVDLMKNRELIEVKGELKDPKYEPALKDVTSARIYLKLLNFEAQQLLVRYVEPLSAMLKMGGESVELDEIKQSWKLVLLSHPHDSICGCSIDAVHRDVEGRLRNAIELGTSLVAKYMRKFAMGGNVIAVFNPYEREIKTVVRALVNTKNDNYELFDEAGKNLRFFTEEVSAFKTLSESGKAYMNDLTYLSAFQEKMSPIQVLKLNTKLMTFEATLSPLSVNFFRLKEGTSEAEKPVGGEPNFENDFYEFRLNKDGSFDLKDKTNGVSYKNLNYFEDVADAGDEYNFSPLEKDMPVTSLGKEAEICEIKDYGFSKEIKVAIEMKIPESLAPSRKRRKRNKKSTKINVVYTLYKHSPRIDVKVNLENQARDHKLSFVAEIPERLSIVKNDGYFGMVNHPIDVKRFESTYVEEEVSRYAMESFAFFGGNKCKLLVTTRGIHEYETHVDNENTKATFTLLRSVGWLSRDDLLTRKGHAGPPIPTPEAQCLGKYELRYSFSILNSVAPEMLYKAAREYICEPLALYLNSENSNIESREKDVPFTLEEGLFLSAFKISQDGERVIARVLNVTDSPKRVFLKKWKAKRVNMSEEISTGKLESTIVVFPYLVESFEILKEGVSK